MVLQTRCRLRVILDYTSTPPPACHLPACLRSPRLPFSCRGCVGSFSHPPSCRQVPAAVGLPLDAAAAACHLQRRLPALGALVLLRSFLRIAADYHPLPLATRALPRTCHFAACRAFLACVRGLGWDACLSGFGLPHCRAAVLPCRRTVLALLPRGSCVAFHRSTAGFFACAQDCGRAAPPCCGFRCLDARLPPPAAHLVPGHRAYHQHCCRGTSWIAGQPGSCGS